MTTTPTSRTSPSQARPATGRALVALTVIIVAVTVGLAALLAPSASASPPHRVQTAVALHDQPAGQRVGVHEEKLPGESRERAPAYDRTAPASGVGAETAGTGPFRAGASGGDGLGSLEGVQMDVTKEGLAQVSGHLEQFGTYGPNEAMVARLQGALDSGAKISGADAAFYTHELTESELMSGGMSYEEAHGAALARYGISPVAVYAPEVISQFPEEFGPGWKAFWGMSG